MIHWTEAPKALPESEYVLHGRALFPLYDRPTDETNEAFKQIPGVYIDWRARAVECPVHAVAIIGPAVEQSQLGSGSFYWRGMNPVDAAEVERRIAVAELHPGLWDGSNPAVIHPSPLQKGGIRWAVLRDGGSLWHPPGAGKTIQAAIWMLADGHGQDEKPPLALVVTRASVRIHWGNEINKVSPTIRPWISNPSRRQRKDWLPPLKYVERERAAGRRPVLVIGQEEIDRLVWGDPTKAKGNSTAGFLKYLDEPIGSLVYDEVHNLRNPKRKDWIVLEDGKWKGTSKENRVAAAKWLSKHSQRRLATTATPIPNLVKDLWGQLDLIEDGWGKGYSKFVFRHCDAKENGWGGLDDKGSSRVPELKERLRFVRHHVTREAALGDLPPKRRERLLISPEQLVRPTAGAIGEVKKAPDDRTRIEALLRLSASRKRSVVLAMVADAVASGQKVTVFTGRRKDAEQLEAAVAKRLNKLPRRLGTPPYASWMIHGGVSHALREEYRVAYMMHKGGCCLVATGQSMGEGIDLQDTDLAIFAMLPWTPREIEQWEGRFSRKGQKRPVIIRYLIAEGSYDEHVAAILLRKLPAVSEIAESADATGAAETLYGKMDRAVVLARLIERRKQQQAAEDAGEEDAFWSKFD